MAITRRFVLAATGAALSAPVRAQTTATKPVRIGVLTDESGVLSSIAGPGSVLAARMAAEDFGHAVLGWPTEILHADHQNKPDIGIGIARQWFDTEDVEMVTDLANSAVALAVQDLARTRGKVTLSSTGGTLELMGKQCSPTGAVWANDTYSASAGLVHYAIDQLHKRTWFLIGADYAFGHSMLDQAARAIAARGGRVLGTVYHPLGTSDYSSYLLTAQSSGAEAILLGNAATDLINSVKQAREMRISQTLVATIVTIIDVHAMGLPLAQGLTFLASFYWGKDDATRAWSERFKARHGTPPTVFHAGTYSATLTYLKSIRAAGTVDGPAVMGAMRAMPIEDIFSRNGHLRIDGRLVHDMLIARVKTPAASIGEWELFDIIDTVPGATVFRPLPESDCPLVHS